MNSSKILDVVTIAISVLSFMLTTVEAIKTSSPSLLKRGSQHSYGTRNYQELLNESQNKDFEMSHGISMRLWFLILLAVASGSRSVLSVLVLYFNDFETFGTTALVLCHLVPTLLFQSSFSFLTVYVFQLRCIATGSSANLRIYWICGNIIVMLFVVIVILSLPSNYDIVVYYSISCIAFCILLMIVYFGYFMMKYISSVANDNQYLINMSMKVQSKLLIVLVVNSISFFISAIYFILLALSVLR
jgi:hypothetical protein